MSTRRRRPRAPRPQTLSMDWFTEQDPRNRGVLEVPRGYMELGLRCPRCGQGQTEFLRSTADQPNLRCQHCGGFSAIGSWRIIYIKNVPLGV